MTDRRNDASLARTIARLPRGSGLIFRHYHLDPAARRARFGQILRLCRRRGHCVILAGSAAEARRWGADGAYGPPERLNHGPALLRLASAHSLRELGRAGRADAVLLSPVFATRSHPGARPLGALRWALLAARAQVPVIALGGMDARRARRLRHAKWAAIDAFCDQATRGFPKDS